MVTDIKDIPQGKDQPSPLLGTLSLNDVRGRVLGLGFQVLRQSKLVGVTLPSAKGQKAKTIFGFMPWMDGEIMAGLMTEEARSGKIDVRSSDWEHSLWSLLIAGYEATWQKVAPKDTLASREEIKTELQRLGFESQRALDKKSLTLKCPPLFPEGKSSTASFFIEEGEVRSRLNIGEEQLGISTNDILAILVYRAAQAGGRAASRL